MENKVPLSICYLPSTCVTSQSPRFLWSFDDNNNLRSTGTRPKFSRRHRCISADKLQRTKDRAGDAIREVSFRRGLHPTATALQQLQREAAPRRVGAGKSCERHLRVSSAVQGCINLALSLHSVTPFLSTLLHLSLLPSLHCSSFPANAQAPSFFLPCCSFVMPVTSMPIETDMHRYCTAWLCCCV